MKFIIIIAFVYSNAFSQELKTEINTPGKELIKASNHYYKGVGFTIAGSTALIISSVSNGDKFTLITGSGLCLVGAAFIIESNIHIKRAGILMDNLKVSYSGNSVGICYQF